ncbi:MAG: AEC family transporter [Acutalibacteraceae bacterium]|nr:AEC family transporter [Acutalibacteraceae bacterium]
MFFENVKITAQQVGILYIIVLVGAICDKIGLFTEKTAKACTDLLFYIITPCVIVQSFLNQEFTKETGIRLLVAVGCGFLMHFVAIILNLPLYRKGDREKNDLFRYSSIYGNVGYMTLPLTEAILGTEGVFYCSAVVMAFNTVSFTHGVYVMNSNGGKFDKKKLFFNPGVISVLIGLPLFILKVDLPDIINQPISYISTMQTPIAMLIFGTFLAHTRFNDIFKYKKILLVSVMKLFVLPAAMVGIYYLLGLSGTLLIALTISACAPTANNTVMFAAKYNKDTGLAAQIVAMVSFISVITMPLIIAAVQTIA